MSAPEHIISDRGLAYPEPVRGTDNATVEVHSSSAVHSYWPEVSSDGKVTQGEAAGPFLWVRVRLPEVEAAAHLTVEAARELRDQLSWLIERADR